MYNYDDILREMKSLKTPEEKKEFIQKTIDKLKASELKAFSDKPLKRIEHSLNRINYLEDILSLRNILIESFFGDKQ
jgi:TnpA family transposase